MKIKIRMNTLASFIALLFVIIGCSHDPKVAEYPATANPEEEVFLLNRDMNTAKNAQADVLSPKNFEKAVEHQKEAIETLNENKTPKVILKHVALSRHYLNKSNQITALAETHLKGVSRARQRAIDAGAESYYSYELTKADRKLKDLTADMERDEFSDAHKYSAETQVRYLGIELMALKKSYLNESENLVKQAKKEGAEKHAPKSLARAEKSIKDTIAFITANRKDQYGMMTESQKTKAVSQKLLKITRDVKSGRSATSEDMALKIDDQRNRVVSLNQRMAQQEQNASTNQLQISQLNSDNQKMKNKEELQQKIKEATKRFDKKEASVYRQGDNLLIRLHGLKYESSKSNLSASNLALLNKVNLAIQDLDASEVQINGHTDSVGGKGINQKVSESRARVIKEYLTSRSTDDDLLFESNGLDFQQPIASNKTAQGREMNRRVDIVIVPTTESVE